MSILLLPNMFIIKCILIFSLILVSTRVPNAADVKKVSNEISSILNVVPNSEVIWENFGLALLKIDENTVLTNFVGNFANRCRALLDYWRKVYREEGWDQVIIALNKQAELKALATKLEEDLKSLMQQNPKQLPQASDEPPSEKGKCLDEFNYGVWRFITPFIDHAIQFYVGQKATGEYWF